MFRRIDKYHIAKFHGWFGASDQLLVFEKMDTDLYEYMRDVNRRPMLLSDVRAVIQQV